MSNLKVAPPDVVKDYFRRKAATYDLVDGQAYWRLSDALLAECIERFAVPELDSFRFLDIGGGTGRWTLRLLENYAGAEATLVDLTQEMVDEAERKLRASHLVGRVDLIVADAQAPHDRVRPGTYDLAICFHNVLGFSENPGQLIAQAYASLRPGGRFAALVPNAFHATFFNLQLGRLDEAEMSAGGTLGRFTGDMPLIHMFTPESIRTTLETAGFEVSIVTGFPSFVYPGQAETTASSNTEALAALLSDSSTFERVRRIEAQHIGSIATAARGNNIFIVGVK